MGHPSTRVGVESRWSFSAQALARSMTSSPYSRATERQPSNSPGTPSGGSGTPPCSTPAHNQVDLFCPLWLGPGPRNVWDKVRRAAARRQHIVKPAPAPRRAGRQTSHPGWLTTRARPQPWLPDQPGLPVPAPRSAGRKRSGCVPPTFHPTRIATRASHSTRCQRNRRCR